ncbi:hypothetical protein PG997_011864 [Apiospora hydei]|uniref:Uncharacterized protein n=1 Tax=Apiospora hydei TaxID=1337664 RepID=A0ABR1V1P5_9PEZI
MASHLPIVANYPLGNGGVVTAELLESWCRGEGASVHEAYGVETYYSKDQSKFIPGPEPAVVALRQLLVQVGQLQIPTQLDVFNDNQSSHVQTTSLDLLKCSWDDVINQLEAAKVENGKHSKKAKRRIDRAIDSAAPYMEYWIECLPEEYGLSVVKGGLTLLFVTARRKEQNREKIIQVFEEIPGMIRTIDAAYKLFSRDDDEDVAGLAKSFYDQLCEDIPQLVEILNGTKTRFSRMKNRFAGGSLETQTVDSILGRLNQRSSAMKTTIDRIKTKLQAKTSDDLQVIRSRIEDTNMGIAIVSGQLGGLASKDDLERLLQKANGKLALLGTQLIDTVRHEVQSQVKSILKDHSAADHAAEAKTMLLWITQEIAMLRERVATQNLQIEYSHPRQPSPRPIPETPVLSEQDLMHILDVDPRSWTEDLASVLRQASRMDADSKARARWLMKTQHFQRWFGASHSALLLAAGALRLEKVSPMSVFTSSIALNLLEPPDTIMLHFFCGKHLDADAEDHLSGPLGMLRCLIAQLVIAFKAPLPNLNAIGSPQFIHDCYNRTLNALCEVFRLLVEHTPHGVTVFVLIDGVSWYEQGDWTADLNFIIGLFKVLTEPHRLPVFKVLLTSPSRAMEVQNLVDLDSDIVLHGAINAQ